MLDMISLIKNLDFLALLPNLLICCLVDMSLCANKYLWVIFYQARSRFFYRGVNTAFSANPLPLNKKENITKFPFQPKYNIVSFLFFKKKFRIENVY